MTKQEQIEEIAGVMHGILCSNQECKTCIIKQGCQYYIDSEAIYNAGYRKIDDNCEVITKDDLNIYKKQAVKNFSEKLKDKLQEFVYDNEDYDGKVDSGTLYGDVIGIIGNNGEIVSLGLIDELVKEYEK